MEWDTATSEGLSSFLLPPFLPGLAARFLAGSDSRLGRRRRLPGWRREEALTKLEDTRPMEGREDTANHPSVSQVGRTTFNKFNIESEDKRRNVRSLFLN